MKTMRPNIAVLMIMVMAVIITLSLSGGIARAAGEVTTQELVENMEKYDGREVTITGEAIGDILKQGDYGWVTVNDDAYSGKSIEEGGEFAGLSNMGIGVWAPAGDLNDIHILGGYKNKGDLLRVTGTFNRVCHEHGGDTDIHAASVEVLEQGHPFSHPFEYWKLILVLGLAGVIVALWDVRRRRIREALRKT